MDYESPSGFNLVRADTPKTTLTIAALATVFANPCSSTPVPLGRTVDEVLAWLRANTGLSRVSERSTTIDGRPASVFEIATGGPCPGGPADLPLFQLNGELFALDPGDVAEITVVDFPGGAITSIAAGPTTTFAAFLEMARATTASISDR